MDGASRALDPIEHDHLTGRGGGGGGQRDDASRLFRRRCQTVPVLRGGQNGSRKALQPRVRPAIAMALRALALCVWHLQTARDAEAVSGSPAA